MSDIWTIKGEIGKALDATVRSLSGIAVAPKVTFRNMETDTLEWTVDLAEFTPTSGDIIPELKQVVELFRNGGRFFYGHVTSVKQRGFQIMIQVSGPWWWLERIFLETPLTDVAGTTQGRATLALPSQSLTTSLTSLINKAATLGAPLGVGTLAATFSAPNITINQMSFSQAIAEVARLTPDIVLFFAYGGTGFPTLCSMRRKSGLGTGTAPSLTLDATTLESFELNPVTELVVSQVRIPYVYRNAEGIKLYGEQSSGTAATGQVQILTVSGDEMDTFLPNDKIDSVIIPKCWSAAYDEYFCIEYDARLQEAKLAGGIRYLGLPYAFADVWLGFRGANYTGPSTKLVQDPTVRKFTNASGATVSSTGKYFIPKQTLPDWAIAQLGAVAVTYSGVWHAYTRATYETAPVYAANYQSLMPGAKTGVGWTDQITNATMAANYIYWLERPFSFEGWLINLNYIAQTRLGQSPEYYFINPPAGFAAGLLGAQNYLPYYGSFSLMQEDCGFYRYMQYAINLSNAQTAHETMRSMVTEEELDLETGVTTVTLGAPVRFSYNELANKMRSNSNDQIIYF